MNEFGSLAPLVGAATQVVAAGVALMAVVSGRSLWSPAISGLPNYAIRIFGVGVGVGMAALLIASRDEQQRFPFTGFAIGMAVVGTVGALIYLYVRTRWCFNCEGDKTLYVRGFVLNEYAAKVMAGDTQDLPPQYVSPGARTPATIREFFCGSGKDPDFVWKEGSASLAGVIVVLAYGALMVPLTLALVSAGLALARGG